GSCRAFYRTFHGVQMAVFVLDKHHKPLIPCSEKRARLLLQRGRARVHRLHPFTIRLFNHIFKKIRMNSRLCESNTSRE
ncbi:MAG: RRXRR domain-containing protein, partial [Desulfovibrionaceae bacterium]|nr:RRXRR domain-containing protein [Desulfovibrionaceae bacterium]